MTFLKFTLLLGAFTGFVFTANAEIYPFWQNSVQNKSIYLWCFGNNDTLLNQNYATDTQNGFFLEQCRWLYLFMR